MKTPQQFNAKRSEYIQQFSIGTNTNASLANKLELFYLLCYLTQKMKEKDPIKYGTPLKVLCSIFKRDFETEYNETNSGESDYITTLGILCEDFIWGTSDIIEPPQGFKTGTEIVDRIKELIKQWLPF